MRRGLGVVLCLLALVAAVLGRPGSAAATADGCTTSGTYPNVSVVISLVLDGSSAALRRGPGAELLVNGLSCSPAAYMTSRPTVYVMGAPKGQFVEFELGGGPFHDDVHGADLHFVIDLGAGDVDFVSVAGTSGADFVAAGADGLNLDAGDDSDLDAVVGGAEDFSFSGRGGADIYSANGSFGTGAPLPVPGHLNGNAGPDILVGSPERDSISGGEGDDRLYGMGGRDGVTYISATSGVAVDLAGGAATGDGTDQLSGVEDVFGSPQADLLRGNGAANVLSGFHGNDFVEGRGGNDKLDGGTDFDTALYTGASGRVVVSLQSHVSYGADGSDTLYAIEGIFGSPFNDVLVGDDEANVLSGQDGNDALWGRDGNDQLRGDAGNDGMNGGPGTDSCQNGPGTDVRSACETQ